MGNPEISDLELLHVQDDILRFQIMMNVIVLMNDSQPLAYVFDQLENFPLTQYLSWLRVQVAFQIALAELQNNIDVIINLS